MQSKTAISNDGRHDEFAGFDQETFAEIVQRFSDGLDVRPDGWWKLATADEIWRALVGQHLVTQSTGGAKELAFINSNAFEPLRMEAIDRIIHEQGRNAAETVIARILSTASLRMASRKAGYIVANYSNHRIVRRPAECVILDLVRFLDPSRVERAERVTREQQARDVLKQNIVGFGNKSASDFLLEIGFAGYLVAFDIRVMALLYRLGVGVKVEDVQADPVVYARLEAFLREVVCPRAGILPRTLDRMLYQRKAEIDHWLDDRRRR